MSVWHFSHLRLKIILSVRHKCYWKLKKYPLHHSFLRTSKKHDKIGGWPYSLKHSWYIAVLIQYTLTRDVYTIPALTWILEHFLDTPTYYVVLNLRTGCLNSSEQCNVMRIKTSFFCIGYIALSKSIIVYK